MGDIHLSRWQTMFALSHYTNLFYTYTTNCRYLYFRILYLYYSICDEPGTCSLWGEGVISYICLFFFYKFPGEIKCLNHNMIHTR